MESNKIIKQILGTGGFSAIGQAGSFIGVIAYTQLVPPEKLGVYFLFVAILEVVSYIGARGVSADITRRLNQSTTPDREMTNSVLFSVIISILSVTLIIILSPLIKSLIIQEYVPALILLLPASVFGFLSRGVLRGEKKNTIAEALVAARKTTIYSAGILLITSGIGAFEALIGGLIFGKLVELSSGIIFIEVGLTREVNIRELVDLTKRVSRLTLVNFGDIGQQWIDTVLIGVFLTPASVSLYEIAWRLSGVGLMVTNAISSVLYPRTVTSINKGDIDQAVSYIKNSLLYVTIPLVALVMGGLAIGPDIVTQIYGEHYANSYVALLILLVGRIPYSYSRISRILGYGLNLDAGIARASIVASTLNLISNVILIPLMGINGAAIASAFSFTALHSILSNILPEGPYKPQLTNLVPIVASSVIMLVFTRIVKTSVVMNRFRLFSIIFISAILYFALVLILSKNIRRDVELILDI